MTLMELNKWRTGRCYQWLSTLGFGKRFSAQLLDLTRQLTKRYYNCGFNDGAESMKKHIEDRAIKNAGG